MANAETWKVLPHRPIEKLESNLWRVDGNLPSGSFTRVMTIAKLPSGGLVVHNAIALEEEQMKEIEAFGEPAYIVAPGAYHRLDLKAFKDRYPKAKVVAPAGAKARIEKVVKVDAAYDGVVEDGVRLVHLAGVKDREGVLEVDHGQSKTLVFNDCINNVPKLGGVFGFVFGPTGVAAVPRLAHWLLVKDKAALRTHLEKTADDGAIARIIVSHGSVITDKPAETLKTVASRLA
jgi:hypothetical protein